MNTIYKAKTNINNKYSLQIKINFCFKNEWFIYISLEANERKVWDTMPVLSQYTKNQKIVRGDAKIRPREHQAHANKIKKMIYLNQVSITMEHRAHDPVK